VLIASTDVAFVRMAGATISDNTANGFAFGSMPRFSNAEPTGEDLRSHGVVPVALS
jgi:hypothetical protein